MCFFSGLTLPLSELKSRFQVEIAPNTDLRLRDEWNAFTFPHTPVITHTESKRLQSYQWGLLPSWAKETDFARFTLNAKWETLSQKPSFRPYLQQRCLVLANVFYEWQWLDEKGKNKQKYSIRINDAAEAFAYAGLWNRWINPYNNTPINTYTIITQPANGIMSEIHNSKKRMPMILRPENESRWLSGMDLLQNEVELIATPV